MQVTDGELTGGEMAHGRCRLLLDERIYDITKSQHVTNFMRAAKRRRSSALGILEVPYFSRLSSTFGQKFKPVMNSSRRSACQKVTPPSSTDVPSRQAGRFLDETAS